MYINVSRGRCVITGTCSAGRSTLYGEKLINVITRNNVQADMLGKRHHELGEDSMKEENNMLKVTLSYQ